MPHASAYLLARRAARFEVASTAFRHGTEKTLLLRPPSSSRTSASQARASDSGKPMGMSIATTAWPARAWRNTEPSDFTT